MRKLTAIYNRSPSDNFDNILKLAEVQELNIDRIELDRCSFLDNNCMEERSFENLVIDVETIKILLNYWSTCEFIEFIKKRTSNLLLIVSDAKEYNFQLLSDLTRGIVQKVSLISGNKISFPENPYHVIDKLAGSEFMSRTKNNLILRVKSGFSNGILMSFGGHPSFIRTRIGMCNLYIWANNKIADSEALITTENDFEEEYGNILPGIIFIRSSFGDYCWRNSKSCAGIIIDDPLIRLKYGFIKFEKLLQSSKKNNCHITLAFIPWNYRRNRKKGLRLFLDNKKNISICIHGCDHIKNEFISEDYELLLAKIDIAIKRMETMREKTSLNYERIFVFPQGKFSTQALWALSRNGKCLATVNSTCIPQNLTEGQVRMKDLMFPALESFYGYPVLKRRAPFQKEHFAVDLFLGKPALVVEHHEYFRNGYEDLERLCHSLKKIDKKILWRPLSETIINTHIKRKISSNLSEIRFFSNIFKYYHTEKEGSKVILRKKISNCSEIENVTINGKQTGFYFSDPNWINMEIEPDVLGLKVIQLTTKSKETNTRYPSNLEYQLGVAARRVLSELRDNVISKNRIALRFSKYIAKKIGKTSDTP